MAKRIEGEEQRAHQEAPTVLSGSVRSLLTLEGNHRRILSVALDPQGGTLATGSHEGMVKLWGAQSGELLRTLEVRQVHPGSVWSVAFDPQDGILAGGFEDGMVRLWEARSGELLRILKGHQRRVLNVAFDPQGGTLASGSWTAR